MKMSAAWRGWVLGISGVVGLCVGAALLILPVAFYAAEGVDLRHQPGLLSDLRGTGGSIVALAALMVTGARLPRFRHAACWVSTLVYLSYALSRGLGWAVDGRPSGFVLASLFVELALGLLGLAALVTLPRPPEEAA